MYDKQSVRAGTKSELAKCKCSNFDHTKDSIRPLRLKPGL